MSVSLTALNPRWQRLAVITALLNIVVYGLTIAWAWLGEFGLAWTHLLNRTLLGDMLLVWFCVSAILLLAYASFVQFHSRALTLAGLACLSWFVLWGAELAWFHRFVVFG